MDLQKVISDLVSKLTGNNDLISKFTSDPLATIKDLLGIDLNNDQLSEVVNGVKNALGSVAGDAVKNGLLDKLKSFFGGDKA